MYRFLRITILPRAVWTDQIKLLITHTHIYIIHTRRDVTHGGVGGIRTIRKLPVVFVCAAAAGAVEDRRRVRFRVARRELIVERRGQPVGTVNVFAIIGVEIFLTVFIPLKSYPYSIQLWVRLK